MRIKLTLVAFLTFIVCFSQNTVTNGFQVDTFAPKSHEAAAFLKYGEYPVDLSTGQLI